MKQQEQLNVRKMSIRSFATTPRISCTLLIVACLITREGSRNSEKPRPLLHSHVAQVFTAISSPDLSWSNELFVKSTIAAACLI